MNQEAVRDRLCELVKAPDAEAVLDAGCGKGEDLRRMSRRFGPDTRLVGADKINWALKKAWTEAADDSRVSFSSADLSQLWPFSEEVFDCVFSNNVLECVPDKLAFLAEAARVLRPGGQVVCAHWDHDTHVFDSADKALVRRIVSAHSDWQQGWMASADGWMGRRLWRTFQASGLFTGRIETLTLTETEFAPGTYGYEQMKTFGAMAFKGLISNEDFLQLLEAAEVQAERGEYFYSLNLYAYVGRKL